MALAFQKAVAPTGLARPVTGFVELAIGSAPDAAARGCCDVGADCEIPRLPFLQFSSTAGYGGCPYGVGAAVSYFEDGCSMDEEEEDGED